MMSQFTLNLPLLVLMSFSILLSGCKASDSELNSASSSSSSSSSSASSASSSSGNSADEFASQLEGITKLDLSIINPVGWLDDVSNAILDDATASAYISFIDGYYASGASFHSDKFKPVKKVFISSAAAIMGKLVEVVHFGQVFPELLAEVTDPDIVVITNAVHEQQSSPFIGNLYSYSVRQTIDSVTADLTIDFLFRGPTGSPSIAAPEGGSETFLYRNVHVNISGSVAFGDVSLSFVPASSGDHLSGSISVEFPVNEGGGPISISTRNLEASLPVTLSDGNYTFSADIDAAVPAGNFDILIADSEADSSSLEAAFLSNLDVSVGLDIFGDGNNIQAVADLNSVMTDPKEVKVAWGGALESLEFLDETDNNFLAIESALNFSAVLSNNVVDVDLIQERLTATHDKLAITVESGGDAISVNHLVRAKDGSIIELDAVKLSTGETAFVSDGVIIFN